GWVGEAASRPGQEKEVDVSESPEPIAPSGVIQTLAEKAILERDDDALRALVALLGTDHYGKIENYLLPIAGAHTSTRQDAVQDTFVRFMDLVRSGELREVPVDIVQYIKTQAAYGLRDRLKPRKGVAQRHKANLDN